MNRLRKINIQYIREFTVFFVVIFLAFSIFMNYIMTQDYVIGYASRNKSVPIQIKDVISGGRYMSLPIRYVYNFLLLMGISHYQNSWVLQIIGMMLYAASAVMVFRLFRDFLNLNNKLVEMSYYVAILIMFVNPFMIETYIYGAFDWGVGISLAILGAYYWCKKRYLIAVFTGFLSLSVYQSNIFIMLTVILFYIFLQFYIERYSMKQYLFDSLISIVSCIGIAMLNVIIQKVGILIINFRHPSEGKFEPVKNFDISLFGIERIKTCFISAVTLLYRCYRMLPKGSMLLACFLIFSILLYINIREGRYWESVFFLLTSIVSCASFFSYGMIYSAFYPQRTMLGLFFILALMFVTMIAMVSRCDMRRQTLLIKLGCMVTFATFLVLFVYTQLCSTDAYISQATDQYEARIIGKIIEDYENSTGDHIDTIASCGAGDSDLESSPLSQELLRHYYGIVPYNRITYWPWARGEYINYVNNTSYNTRAMTEDEVEKYFGGRIETPGYFDPKTQIVFEDNTLFWRVY